MSEPVPHHADPPAGLDCKRCGRGFGLAYWHTRLEVLGGNATDTERLCDECIEQAVRYHEHRTNNRQLDEFECVSEQEASGRPEPTRSEPADFGLGESTGVQEL